MPDNYNKDLEIDFSRLDEIWRDHSVKFMKWSEKWVNAVSERDRAKEALEVVKAELDSEIRTKYVGKKPTEAAINSMITTNKEYQEAVSKLIDANESVNLLASAKTAFEHKKKALESLTQLWIQGYWSEPKIQSEFKMTFDNRYIDNQKQKLSENQRLQRKANK